MIKRVIVLILGVTLSACLDVEPLIESVKAFECGSAVDCPEGFTCTGGACIDPSRCGDGVVQFGEVCDEGEANSDDWALSPRCKTDCKGYGPHCGDGQPANEEVCDSGDQNTDVYLDTVALQSTEVFCNSTCTAYQPHCGDDITQPDFGETCDDGDTIVNDCPYTLMTCDNVCGASCTLGPGLPNICGDGNLGEVDLAAGEVCDDGNLFDELGGCMGDCSAATICADGESHLGVCSQEGNLREGQDRFLTLGSDHACVILEAGKVECWGQNTHGQLDVPDTIQDAIAVSAGDAHTCAIKGDGTVVCWGAGSSAASCGGNNFGVECGQSAVPAELGQAVAISAGFYHTCAIDAEGGTLCWGAGAEPRDWSVSSQTEYGQSIVPPDLPKAIAIASGKQHTCVLLVDESVRCWGRNSRGQSNPPADLGPVYRIAIGNWHSCAVQKDGMIRCWGDNSDDQAAIPPDVSQVLAGAGGSSHTCVLEPFGTARCWGRGDYGQTTVPPDLSYAVAVATGSLSSCAVSQDGQLRCWGSIENEDVPQESIDAIEVVGGEDHTCALSRMGRVICWGGNDYRQSTPPANLQDAVKVVAGRYHTCAVRSDQTVSCWGAGKSELYCNPEDEIQDCGQSMVPDELGPVRDLSAGQYHTCAVTTDQRVACWGLGQGTEGCGDSTHPNTEWNCGQAIVPTDLPPVVGVTTGEFHTCALTDNGQVQCWGAGILNGNCDGSEYHCEQALVPDDLVTPVRQIAAGYHHTCAVQQDNQIRCWGRNDEGQTSVPNGLGIPASLSAGYAHTCTVAVDGTPRCWGAGDVATMGDGSYANAYGQSVIPDALPIASQIGAGERHTCGVKPNGGIVCWGLGSSTAHNSGLGKEQAIVPAGWPMRVGYRDAPFGYIRTSAYTYESACSGGAIFGLLKDDAAGGHALAGFGCMLPECGDGRVEGDEACDDGNTADGDLCSADCRAETPICGDAIVTGDEACDDGNTEGGDFCSADCSEILPGCGDGIVSGDEDCDDGDFNDTNLCSNACTLNDLDCEVISFVSDGYCDSENNTGGCGWDGGDCCPSTCVDTPSYTCSDSVSSCQDPSACENIGGCP